MMRGWMKINMQFIFLLVCFSVRKSSLSKLLVILLVKKLLLLHLLEQNMIIFIKLLGNLVSSWFVELLPQVPAGWCTLLAFQGVMFQPMGLNLGPHMRTGSPGVTPWGRGQLWGWPRPCEGHFAARTSQLVHMVKSIPSSPGLPQTQSTADQGDLTRDFASFSFFFFPKWTARIENSS